MSAPKSLELGRAVPSEIRGGESHDYQVSLDAGQYAHVVIDQKNIDLTVAAFDPSGGKMFEANVGAQGQPEHASVIASVAGRYRIQVSAGDDTAPTGEYEIKLAELHAATETDKSRVAGERAVAEGMALYIQQKAEARQAAIKKFQEGAEYWRAAKDLKEESGALVLEGDTYKDLGEKQPALDTLNRALQVAQASGDKPAEAWALVNLAYAYQGFGEIKTGLPIFERALPLWSNTPGDGLLRTLNGLGVSYAELDDKRKGIEYFEQALATCRQLHNQFLEATVLNNLAVTYGRLGEYRKQIELDTESLGLRRHFHDRAGEAVALNNIGSAYSSLGDYQKAMDSYTAAFNIAHELGVPQDEGVDLNNIAWVYGSTGDFDNALKFYQRSVDIMRKAKDRWRLAVGLTNLGATYADLHQYEKALEIYRESLELNQILGNRHSEANTLHNMAYAYGKMGDKPKSLEFYLKAVDILRTAEDPLLLEGALRNAGNVYRIMGEPDKALGYVKESIQISTANGDRRGEAESLGTLARVELDKGELPQALKDGEEALAKFDSLRSTITNPRMRTAFSQADRKVRETNLQILLRLHQQQPSAGYDAAALMAAERTRARTLLEMLGESQTRIREGVDPALLEQEVALRQTIAIKARLRQRLSAGKHTDEQVAEATRELDGLTHEYDQLQSTIRKKSPAYAALTMPVPLTLAEIQHTVLDEETLLLEYALGEEKSFLFAVSPQSIEVFELPKRDIVEAAALRVYELLTEHNHRLPGETPQQRGVRLRRAEADYPQAAAALSRMVLGPAGSKLGSKRLLIVADGALQYVPFTALPDPLMAAPATAPPLIARHEIVAAPSASVLSVIRSDASRRKPAAKLLAILADPVFENDDPRLPQHEKVSASSATADVPADVTRSGAESGLERFERLRFSRREAETITQLVKGPDRFTALDFTASRSTATSPELAQYRIVHFATHGIINNQHPDLSGLVLSLVNEKGEAVDGFLRLYDIYNLKLQADLVVLSACQTALGKEMAGEGLIGMTRGFVYAGAPRVVASLWRIDDRVTAELMRSFYSSMLTRGERPAAALRAAQLAMWKTTGWESPYYWAAFTLQGEWK